MSPETSLLRQGTRRRNPQSGAIPRAATAGASVDAVAAVAAAAMDVEMDALKDAAMPATMYAAMAATADQSAPPSLGSRARRRTLRLPALRNQVELSRSVRPLDISPSCFPGSPFRSTSATPNRRPRRNRHRRNRTLGQFPPLHPRPRRPWRQPSRKMNHSSPAKQLPNLFTNSTAKNTTASTKTEMTSATTACSRGATSQSRQLPPRRTGIANSAVPKLLLWSYPPSVLCQNRIVPKLPPRKRSAKPTDFPKLRNTLRNTLRNILLHMLQNPPPCPLPNPTCPYSPLPAPWKKRPSRKKKPKPLVTRNHQTRATKNSKKRPAQLASRSTRPIPQSRLPAKPFLKSTGPR